MQEIYGISMTSTDFKDLLDIGREKIPQPYNRIKKILNEHTLPTGSISTSSSDHCIPAGYYFIWRQKEDKQYFLVLSVAFSSKYGEERITRASIFKGVGTTYLHEFVAGHRVQLEAQKASRKLGFDLEGFFGYDRSKKFDRCFVSHHDLRMLTSRHRHITLAGATITSQYVRDTKSNERAETYFTLRFIGHEKVSATKEEFDLFGSEINKKIGEINGGPGDFRYQTVSFRSMILIPLSGASDAYGTACPPRWQTDK